jgi:hypothetical protein
MAYVFFLNFLNTIFKNFGYCVVGHILFQKTPIEFHFFFFFLWSKEQQRCVFSTCF